MKITKIVPAVKTPGRYNIFVDEKYSFSLDEYQLVNTGLHSGIEIDEEKLASLKNESDFGKEYIRAIDLISHRLRSEKEIRDYAWRKRWPPENTARVIQRLYDKGYLNDKVFAQTFVRARTNAGRYSRRRIEQDLRKKGISKDIISEVLGEDFSDQEALLKLIRKRAHHYDDESKLKAYLMRAGFKYEDINRALTEYKEKE